MWAFHLFNTMPGGLFMMFNTISGGLFTMFNKSSGGLFTMFNTISGRLFTIFDSIVNGVAGAMTGFMAGLYNGVRDFLGAISGAVQTVWDAFVLMCKTFGKAAETVWPYAKIEDISRLVFMAIALVYAPQIAAGVQRILVYFAGAAIAVKYGQGPAVAAAKAPAARG